MWEKKGLGWILISVGEDGWWGAGNRLGDGQPAESWWGVAGVSWHCGGGHMEGRLALWLPLQCAPADRGRLPRGGSRERDRGAGRGTWAEFGLLETASKDFGY